MLHQSWHSTRWFYVQRPAQSYFNVISSVECIDIYKRTINPLDGFRQTFSRSSSSPYRSSLIILSAHTHARTHLNPGHTHPAPQQALGDWEYIYFFPYLAAEYSAETHAHVKITALLHSVPPQELFQSLTFNDCLVSLTSACMNGQLYFIDPLKEDLKNSLVVEGSNIFRTEKKKIEQRYFAESSLNLSQLV